MSGRLVSVFLAVCAVAALGGSTGSAVPIASAQPVSGTQRISHDAIATYNWAGYSVHRDGTTFSDVQGTWTQPTASCSSNKMQLAAFFVGLDGAIDTSTSVEQIGTDADCVHGNADYYAWYEMYPNPPVRISDSDCAISPGHSISGQVHANGGSSFTVTLKIDGTTCFTSTVTAPGTPLRLTAEWIAEAPSTGGHFWPLTDFDHVGFSHASATGNSHTGDINDPTSWDDDSITMIDHGNPHNLPVKAQESDLNVSGDGFTVDWVSS